MIEYVRNILPRLEKFSRKLDKTEVFVEKSWIHIDESNNHHEYIFMRDKRLILSVNGAVITGTWELLPNGKLLLNSVKDEILFQNIFFTDAIMILQKSGSNEDPLTFINEDRIPDLDVVRYLQDLYDCMSLGNTGKNDESKELTVPFKPEPNVIKILSSGKIVAHDYSEGYKVISHDGNLVTGTFHIPDHRKDAHMDVNNGKVELICYIISYKNKSGQLFKVKQQYADSLKGGVIIGALDELGLKPNEINEISSENNDEDYKVKINENGIITSESNSFGYDLLMFLAISFVVFVILFFIFKVVSNK